MSRERWCQEKQRGQATVEFALIIPLVFVALLAVVQVAAVAYAQLEVTHAAHEAVRTLSVDPGADLDGLADSTGLIFTVVHVPASAASAQSGVVRGDAVRVIAIHALEPVSPLFGALLAGRTVRSEAQMFIE